MSDDAVLLEIEATLNRALRVLKLRRSMAEFGASTAALCEMFEGFNERESLAREATAVLELAAGCRFESSFFSPYAETLIILGSNRIAGPFVHAGTAAYSAHHFVDRAREQLVCYSAAFEKADLIEARERLREAGSFGGQWDYDLLDARLVCEAYEAIGWTHLQSPASGTVQQLRIETRGPGRPSNNPLRELIIENPTKTNKEIAALFNQKYMNKGRQGISEAAVKSMKHRMKGGQSH